MNMTNLSIIYDVTAMCPHNCAICCMGASSDPSVRKDELSQGQKLEIVRQIGDLRDSGVDVRVDLSGGEIFTDKPNHTELIKALSDTLGKSKVGISCSGYGIDDELASFLAQTVSDVEMTMDVVPYEPYILRPTNYSVCAAKAVGKLKAAGVTVGIQTVVSFYNNTYDHALAVYSWLAANKVDNWSLLRFFPSGKGAAFPEAAMSDRECENYVHMVQGMIAATPVAHKPVVDFHYSMPGHPKHSNICRCVRHSIGILPNGDVVACFWALDSNTGAVDPKYLLGNVKDNTLMKILDGKRAHYWSDCTHCCELYAA